MNYFWYSILALFVGILIITLNQIIYYWQLAKRYHRRYHTFKYLESKAKS